MRILNDRPRELGIEPACVALRVPRASYYRYLQGPKEKSERPKPPRALSEQEQQEVLALLHATRFVDKAPAEIVATLLDEGRYLCSTRTMYRILDSQNEVRERRHQLRHPAYTKPQLLATAPNQVWSWDITKLKGPIKWTFYYLYVILDIYSRYVVGWMVATQEAACLATRLIRETCEKQHIKPDQLLIHSDRGSAMTAKTTAQLLGNLGITKSHSRPHVSNDNPYSESQFKTLKYSAAFPGEFGSIEDSRSFLSGFFHWYNDEHRHSGIAMMTPKSVHYGFADDIHSQRQTVLMKAFQDHPERFINGIPKPKTISQKVWINDPSNTAKEKTQ